MFHRCILTIGLCLLSITGLCQNQSVVIGFGKDRAPYVMSRVDKGISVDLVRAALKHQGYTVIPEYFSASNTEKAMNARVDGISHSPYENDGDYYVSDYYLTFKNCVVTKAASGIDIENLEDMTGHRIVAWPQAHQYLGEEYQQLFSPQAAAQHSPDYMEHESQLAQNQMFWRDRADIIVLDKNIFHWYRHALRETEDTSAEVNFHYLLPEETLVRAAFRRPELRDAFDRGIQTLKASGEYQTIVNRYIVETLANVSDLPPASTRQTALKTPQTSEEASDKSVRTPTEKTGK